MVKRMRADIKDGGETWKVWPLEDVARYLMDKHDFLLPQIEVVNKKLKKHKFEESSWWQQIAGYIWFTVIITEYDKLTPKKLVKILTNIDQLLPYIPNETAQKLIIILDRIAEEIHKRM